MDNKFKILENSDRHSDPRYKYCDQEKQPYIVITKWKYNSKVSIDHNWCFDKIFQKNKIEITNWLIQIYQKYVSISEKYSHSWMVAFRNIPNNQVEKFAEESFDFLSLFFNKDTAKN